MSFTFEITIQRKLDDRWPVVAQLVAAGAELPVRREGVLALDLGDLAGASPEEYGAVLGRSLFRDDVRDGFNQALAEAADGVLHVLLFVEADELRALRWERLAAPIDDGWPPLALDQRTPFALHLPSVTDRRFPPIGRRDLRALIVVANPTRSETYRLTPFDVAEAIRSVRGSLDSIPSDLLAEAEDAIGPPTLDALCRAITGRAYTLLHVVAHGRFKADDGEPNLFLASPEGEVALVSASVLIERLGKLRGVRGLPRFAFLSTCESAAPEAEGVLGGLGQRLVRHLGMPAAVAMTDKITMASALALNSEFYQHLRRHGMVDLALAESYAGIAGRPDVAVPVPALFSRLAGRPLFSLASDGHLSPEDITHGLARMEVLLPERAPALLDPFRAYASVLRGLFGVDAEQLARERRADRERSLAAVDQLCLDGLELTFEALADDREPPPFDARCPFMGMRSFKEGDRPFYYGREAWVERLREQLGRHPFLAVLGPSGSGKSSVVLAGLIPTLRDAEPGLEAVVMTPGDHPAARMVEKLAGIGGRSAVLVVDQFEEAFTLCTDANERRKFFDRLLGLTASWRVIVTMRADFWGDCASHPALRERMRDHQELIPPMTPEELSLAMTRQAEAVGLRFEPGLAGAILEDVMGEPGAMPLLQHALLEVWHRRRGRLLKAEEYQAIGRVQGAIAKTAESVYRDLPDDGERDQIRDLFLLLTRVDEVAAGGEARRDSRQRVRLDQLVPSGQDGAATRRLVELLADKRLLVTTPYPENRTEVEVAHEALIRRWPRLTGWIDENRAQLRLRQGVVEAAEAWRRSGRDESLLVHRGERLKQAQSLRSKGEQLGRGGEYLRLSGPEVAYVDACVAARRKQLLYRGGAIILILGLGLVAIGLFLSGAQRVEAGKRVQELLTSRPDGFLEKVANLGHLRPLVGSRMRELLEGGRLSKEQELRARLTLLPNDPAQMPLLVQELIRADVAMLRVILDALSRDGHETAAVPAFKSYASGEGNDRGARFRAGIALAINPKSGWALTPERADFLADCLLAFRIDDQRDLRSLLRPVAALMIRPLEARFRDPQAAPVIRAAAANALADYARDQPAYLAALACEGDIEQYKILDAVVRGAQGQRQVVIDQLLSIIRKAPQGVMPQDDRVALGLRQAKAAITLLRMKEFDVSREVFRPLLDPEPLTQFSVNARGFGLDPVTLHACLARARDARAHYGLILSLGTFGAGEVPLPEREALLQRLAGLHASHPDSGVHGATGWLLRAWGRGEMADGVDRTPRTYDRTSERTWFVQQVGEDFFTFVVYPPGEFVRGSSEGEHDRDPDEVQHRVRLSRPFAVSDREVTVEQWLRFQKAEGLSIGYSSRESPTLRHPVNSPSWYQAVGYCRWLTARASHESDQCYQDPDGLPQPFDSGPVEWIFRPERHGFRMPTEAEWEYACRAGHRTAFSFGSDRSLIGRYAWYNGNAGRITHPAGTKPPDARGVFDLAGNVHEWCHDGYGPYPPETVSDPTGYQGASTRVVRGGSWFHNAWQCRCADRDELDPVTRYASYGFRLVQTLDIIAGPQ